jgi:hypothetical protein
MTIEYLLSWYSLVGLGFYSKWNEMVQDEIPENEDINGHAGELHLSSH